MQIPGHPWGLGQRPGNPHTVWVILRPRVCDPHLEKHHFLVLRQQFHSGKGYLGSHLLRKLLCSSLGKEDHGTGENLGVLSENPRHPFVASLPF